MGWPSQVLPGPFSARMCFDVSGLRLIVFVSVVLCRMICGVLSVSCSLWCLVSLSILPRLGARETNASGRTAGVVVVDAAPETGRGADGRNAMADG